jgi:hypothetical protein
MQATTQMVMADNKATRAGQEEINARMEVMIKTV